MSASVIENRIQEIVELSARKGPIESLSVATRHVLRLLASFEGQSSELDLLLGTSYFCKSLVDSPSTIYDKEAIDFLGQLEAFAQSEYRAASGSSNPEPSSSLASVVAFLSRFAQECISKPSNLIIPPQEDLYNFYSITTQFYRDQERLQLDFLQTAFEIRDLNLNSLQHRGLIEQPNGGTRPLPQNAWFSEPTYKEEGSAYLRLLTGKIDLHWLRTLGIKLASRAMQAATNTPQQAPSKQAPIKKVAPKAKQKTATKQTTKTEDPSSKPNQDDSSPTTPNFKLPILKMLADTPIEDQSEDLLGYKDYAEALALLIEHKETATPFTIAINAPWGAGKSSIAKMLEKRLTKEREKLSKAPYIVCYFNAWQHDEATNVGAAFAAEVARKASGERDWWQRLFRPLPHKLRSLTEKFQFWIPTLIACIGIGILFYSMRGTEFGKNVLDWLSRLGILDEKKVAEIVKGQGAGEISLLITLVTVAFPAFRTFGKTLAGYIKNPESAANDGTITQAAKQLSDLIAQATGRNRKFVIFVDDLERCRPPKSIEVLEAINQLIAHPNVVTIILGDMPTVAASAAIKYKDVAEMFCEGEEKGPRAVALKTKFGRQYLQKIIQLQFDVPLPSKTEGLNLLKHYAQSAATTRDTESSTLLREIMTDKIPLLSGITRFMLRSARPKGPGTIEKIIAAILAPYIEAWRLRKQLKTLREGVADKNKNYTRIVAINITALLVLYSGLLIMQAWPFVVPGLEWPIVALLSGGLAALTYFFNRTSTRIFRDTQASSVSYVALQIEERLKKTSLDDVKELSALRQSLIGSTLSSPSASTSQPGTDSTGLIDALLNDQINNFLMSDSERLERAMATALQHVPPLPRNLKRLLNSMRVLLFLLARRGLFNDGKLSPEQVGKWAALREMYPEVAQSLLTRDLEIADLEAVKPSAETLKHLKNRYGLDLENDEDLQSLLRSEPKLTSASEAIVYLSTISLTEAKS